MDEVITVDGVDYDAFNEGQYKDGSTTWMVRRYNGSSRIDYKECLFSAFTEDRLTAVRQAIATDTWG